MGNCLGRGEEPKTVTIIIQQGDFNYNDNSNNEKKGHTFTVILAGKQKKEEPSFTSNLVYDSDGQRGKSRRRYHGRPMITEA